MSVVAGVLDWLCFELQFDGKSERRRICNTMGLMTTNSASMNCISIFFLACIDVAVAKRHCKTSLQNVIAKLSMTLQNN
jgi:hypothetical protein